MTNKNNEKITMSDIVEYLDTVCEDYLIAKLERFLSTDNQIIELGTTTVQEEGPFQPTLKVEFIIQVGENDIEINGDFDFTGKDIVEWLGQTEIDNIEVE